MTSSYAIRGGSMGRDRLRVLSRVLEPTTSALLRRVGVPRDARCLDLGCGGGDVTALLAALAPDGHVVGTDRDPVKVELAGDWTAAAGNVELRVEDVAETVERDDSAYDVVYARFVLSHLAAAGTWVQRLAALVRPGGALVVEDIRVAGTCWAPASAAFARYLEVYAETVAVNGGDAELGGHLPRMLLAADLDGIGIEVVQPIALHGDTKRIHVLTLQAIGAAALAAGVTTADELAELEVEVEAFVERPDTVVSTAQIIQTWGRRGAGT